LEGEETEWEDDVPPLLVADICARQCFACAAGLQRYQARGSAGA
jgi:hypothetical protein